jgi:NAD(P)-dependent dehydrogenase (short-subunit alcohol dehydrogenase family)
VIATGRNVSKIKTALQGIETDNLVIVELDVTDEAQAREAVAATTSRFGRLDVLVNNAGYVLSGKFEALATSQVRQLFDTNFFGAINLMRAALPVMREQGAGHILNVSSVAGVLGMANSSAYASSKFALEGLSLSVMLEVERFGIKVTVVEPGYFRTDLVNPTNIKFGEDRSPTMRTAATPDRSWRRSTATSPAIPTSSATRSCRSSAWRTLRGSSWLAVMP